MKDRSPQGFIDEDIRPLLDTINSFSSYETTSSCSGRIVLLTDQKKGDGRWIFKTHEKADYTEMLEALNNSEGTVWLMQEPMILHVKCKDIESAQNLLTLANMSGLKKSGIISTKGLIVEIKGTERIEMPLRKGLITEEYIQFIISEANMKLEKTKERIRLFESTLQKIYKSRNSDN